MANQLKIPISTFLKLGSWNANPQMNVFEWWCKETGQKHNATIWRAGEGNCFKQFHDYVPPIVGWDLKLTVNLELYWNMIWIAGNL